MRGQSIDLRSTEFSRKHNAAEANGATGRSVRKSCVDYSFGTEAAFFRIATVVIGAS